MDSAIVLAMIREIVLLGSGGGRVVTIRQERRTGGLALIIDKMIFVMDPGPGSIFFFNQMGLNPFLVKGVLISHRHPDHYSDAEIYIEAATRGASMKRGLLAGARSVLETVEGMGYPAISDYHKRLPELVAPMSSGDSIVYDGIKINALKSFHSDPYAIGFRLDDGKHSISYFSDTKFSEEIARGAECPDLLILSVLRPGNLKFPGHLCTDDAIRVIGLISPRRVLITHFGSRMIKASPEKEAERIEKSTGISTIAATDGMKIKLSGAFTPLDLYTGGKGEP
ncbi:MAG: MBL fold metallo-hydrolase [Nitrososphaerales archaeon]|nr:MBL fold metallo-hydrolase [Nitrososphaerales archaeon]